MDEDLNENENRDDTIMHNFVSSPPPTNRKDVAINNTLNCMQTENPPVIWPQIDGNFINEFQTPGYIAHAFPTLYPTGDADFRGSRPREIKPAEYFKHLLWYKDGRFVCHTRWRYFTLNS